MKIAIIGGGISGLTCAYYLRKDHDVIVFEANGYAGGHTETHAVSIADESYAIDTGFIVFNEANYPNFTRLLRELKVEWQDSDMSFSAVNERSGMEYGAEGLERLFAQRSNLVNPAFYRMLWDLFRFYRQAPAALKTLNDDVTLGDYLRSGKYSRGFTDNHIVPMACALWSASAELIEQFPLQHFLSFMDNHRMLQINGRPQWKVVKGGSSQYVKKLLGVLNACPKTTPASPAGTCASSAATNSNPERVRLNTPVFTVRRGGEEQERGVTVVTEEHGEEHFNAVIFACHSDQVLKLLEAPTANEQKVLGAIPYQENHITLHSDESLLPASRKAWASWNARIPAQTSERCHVSYWMNSLQGIDSETSFIVSLNCRERIDPGKIWAERIYHHPVFTRESIKAQRTKPLINGVNNTWFCGAYWGWGFHEDGVKSALSVVEEITGSQFRAGTPSSESSATAIEQPQNGKAHVAA